MTGPPASSGSQGPAGRSRDRSLHVPGLVNARDLGGLRRGDGTRTPRGVFFRSENVDGVRADGWEDIADAGIRTVVDLRQPWERRRDQNPRPDWLTTVEVDLDGLENQVFWKDYWDNGLVATPLYYAPHLAAMPERAVAALVAIVSAPAGGVLFHCMRGRDRTGMIAVLLLAAAGTVPEEIVDDYLETARLGEVRAANVNRSNDEADLDGLCRAHGTTTGGAIRAFVDHLDLAWVVRAGGMEADHRSALVTWRGASTGASPNRD